MRASRPATSCSCKAASRISSATRWRSAEKRRTLLPLAALFPVASARLLALAAAAALVEGQAELLRRELAAQRAHHEMPGARVAVLERGTREHALDRAQ